MLAFCNSDPERLWVAYMFWSPTTAAARGRLADHWMVPNRTGRVRDWVR